MNLSEAARTGRPFRRTTEPQYWYLLKGKQIVQVNAHGAGIAITIDAEQLVATDWEPEPVKIEITAQDLLECAKVIAQNPVTHQRRLSPVEMAKLFIEQLGLENK